MSNNAKRVEKSRKKSGAKRVTMDFKPDELAVLEAATVKYGGKKAAVIAGLRLLSGANEPTDAELLDMLSARLKTSA